ncbi:hypothetical protein Moror_11546, partial [Moniliophthora roreri MCA 2997]
MDFITKLPISQTHDSIWVVCDRFTRAAHFIPCNESITASQLAWTFLDRIFRLHGLPTSIVSDRDKLFISKFWQELMSLLQTDIRTSTAYHPQTDGLTERSNQVLEIYLRSYCSYHQDDWVDYLPLAEFSFNNLENASTQQTPFFANLGYHPTFEPRITERSSVPAAKDLAERLKIIYEELKANLQHAQDAQARFYNKNRKPAPELHKGQLVWLSRRNIKTTCPSQKLDHRKLGPYPIEKRIHDTDAYKLKLPSYLSRLHPVFHVSLLEPYKDPSEFHPHSDPLHIQLDETSTTIESIEDSRKVGQTYEYLVHFRDTDQSENSWIPLSEIPSDTDEMIDRFHRRHPRALRPNELLLPRNRDPEIPMPENTTKAQLPND